MWSFTIARYRGTIAKTYPAEMSMSLEPHGGIRRFPRPASVFAGNDSISRFFQLMKGKAFSQELLGGYLAARAGSGRRPPDSRRRLDEARNDTPCHAV
jgi:hypothetical protein